MQTALYVWILERPGTVSEVEIQWRYGGKGKDFNILYRMTERTGQLQKKYVEMVISSIQ